MSNQNKGGKIVYIGGIPFDFTEFDVLNIANTVGTVLSLKLIFDQLTGKSKGYAFVQYADEETAASAVRNLNNFAVGNRHLKCGFSSGSTISGNVTVINPDGTIKTVDDNHNNNNNSGGGGGGNIGNNNYNNGPGGGQNNNKNQIRKKRRLNSGIPPLPPGINVADKSAVFNLISSTLESLDQITLLTCLTDAKEMALRNPELMVELLDQCPQLSSSLVEILLLFQLKSPDDVSKILSAEAIAQSSAAPVTDSNNNSGEQAAQAVPPQQQQPEQQQQSQPETQAQPQPQQQQQQQPAAASTSSEASDVGVDAEQLAAIKQVIQLSPEQIALLPDDQKAAIIQIQENYKSGIYGTL